LGKTHPQTLIHLKLTQSLSKYFFNMQQQQPPPQGVVISTQSLNTTQPPPTESVSVEDARKSLTKWFYDSSTCAMPRRIQKD